MVLKSITESVVLLVSSFESLQHVTNQQLASDVYLVTSHISITQDNNMHNNQILKSHQVNGHCMYSIVEYLAVNSE